MRINWPLLTGLIMLLILLFFACFGSNLPFVDPSPTESRMRFYEDGSMARAPFAPSSMDWLGTDRDGRDLLSLLIVGSKVTLTYIFLIALLRYAIAIPLAFLASTKKGIAYKVTNIWN